MLLAVRLVKVDCSGQSVVSQIDRSVYCLSVLGKKKKKKKTDTVMGSSRTCKTVRNIYFQD